VQKKLGKIFYPWFGKQEEKKLSKNTPMDYIIACGGKIKLTRIVILEATFTFLVFSFMLTACSEKISASSIALDFAPGYTGSPVNDTTDFDETDCVVLRCSSLEENDLRIIGMTSKSMSMKADALLFVRSPEAQNFETYVQVASVPIIGKEYEYDMTHARFYRVTPSSIESVVNNYGIPYSDWQTGACNSLE